MAGPDNSDGSARSFTGASPFDNRARMALRVGSASAAKIVDRSADGTKIIYHLVI